MAGRYGKGRRVSMAAFLTPWTEALNNADAPEFTPCFERAKVHAFDLYLAALRGLASGDFIDLEDVVCAIYDKRVGR